MVTYAQAAAAVQDPGTPPAVLGEIATAHPTLRVAVAAHPAAYPELLAWLAGLGDPLVASALATRARVHAAAAPAAPRSRRWTGLLVGLAATAVLLVGGGAMLWLVLATWRGDIIPEAAVTRQVERTLYELASEASQWRMDSLDGTFEGLTLEDLTAGVDVPGQMWVELEPGADGRSLTFVAGHELLDQVAELAFPGTTITWH